MTYSITRLIDPYRGIFQIVETTDDYETAWRKAGWPDKRFPSKFTS
jgi:hypothetical protein